MSVSMGRRVLRASIALGRQTGVRHAGTGPQRTPAPLGRAAAVAAAAACGVIAASQCNWAATKSKTESERVYTRAEMQQMVQDDRIVVAFRGGLYDVTDFTGHPGGVGRLQMAAGGDLEVFWTVYTQHNRGHIPGILKNYKIGQVSDADMKAITADTFYDTSAYAANPDPYPELLTNTRYPYNAEGQLSKLTDSFITPEGTHFVRNHSAVPDIDPEDYRLTVNGEGVSETVFTLDELKDEKKFPRVSSFRVWLAVVGEHRVSPVHRRARF